MDKQGTSQNIFKPKLVNNILAIFCSLVLILLISGCSKTIDVEIVNHYNFPVQVYFGGGGLRYGPRLLGTISPGNVIDVSVAHIGDGSVYRFSIRNQSGKEIDLIDKPSAQVNASLKDGVLRLLLHQNKNK